MAVGWQDCRIWLQDCRIWLQDSRLAGYAAGLQDCRIWLQDLNSCTIAGYGCRIARLQDMAAG
jgi:hypothetical protein